MPKTSDPHSDAPQMAGQPDSPAAKADGGRLVFLVESDAALARDLSSQIGYFGYTVRLFRDLCSFGAAIKATRPAAIIMDSVSFGDDACSVAALDGIRGMAAKPVPLLFISAHGDMKARLQAVHAGCDAYFTKPVDVGGLIDKLDALTSNVPAEPYRVLIVENSASLAKSYATLLKGAGMVAEVISDPMQTLDKLVEFRPDIVLLDLHMAACDGFELATVIRQQEEFVGISIVFLSAESNIGQQLFALRLGGDDFLIKPIEPAHLVSVVASRVERSRVLRSFMVRDSLTGLLNHTAIKEQLEIQLARTRRLNGKLSFAMLDIDHFKLVNDTYGHSVGDRVLKSLSRLLQQRLRETDIVGRYGGEEFAVILNDTDGPAAVKVLDQIREDLSCIRHLASGKEFSITFSGGVADFPHFLDAGTLGEAADKALYEAKCGGRNRLVLAQG
ncbi:MAG: diguanylate cyclase [Sulfuricella sp.]|nr:diguanylate cyclase [Sulfuricella sp.]